MPWIDLLEGERQVLEELAKGKNLTEACKALGINKVVGSVRMRHVRLRYKKAVEFVKAVDSYKKRLPTKYL